MSELKISRVGLAGCGYWGEKLARTLNNLGVLTALCDVDEDKLQGLGIQYGSKVMRFPVYKHMLSALEGVVIATPPRTHYELAKQALEMGKHVFVEKPMTTSHAQAMALSDLATKESLNLMVGHIYLHNDGIKRMPIPIGKAELYIQLLNEGRGPSESTRDVIWAGLPHACSLALHFFPDMPELVEARREKDRIKATLRYWNGSVVYLDVGDNTGRKLRRVELRERDSRYLFNVSSPNICFLRSGVEVKSFGHNEPYKEPLMEECKAFLEYKGVDLLGPKVVKLIEEIMGACKA